MLTCGRGLFGGCQGDVDGMFGGRVLEIGRVVDVDLQLLVELRHHLLHVADRCGVGSRSRRCKIATELARLSGG